MAKQGLVPDLSIHSQSMVLLNFLFLEARKSKIKGLASGEGLLLSWVTFPRGVTRTERRLPIQKLGHRTAWREESGPAAPSARPTRGGRAPASLGPQPRTPEGDSPWLGN